MGAFHIRGEFWLTTDSTLSSVIQEGSHRVITANPYPPGPLSPAELEKGEQAHGGKSPSPLRMERGIYGVRFDG